LGRWVVYVGELSSETGNRVGVDNVRIMSSDRLAASEKYIRLTTEDARKTGSLNYGEVRQWKHDLHTFAIRKNVEINSYHCERLLTTVFFIASITEESNCEIRGEAAQITNKAIVVENYHPSDLQWIKWLYVTILKKPFPFNL